MNALQWVIWIVPKLPAVNFLQRLKYTYIYIGYWFYLPVFQFREIFMLGPLATSACLFILLHNLQTMHFASGFFASFVYFRQKRYIMRKYYVLPFIYIIHLLVTHIIAKWIFKYAFKSARIFQSEWNLFNPLNLKKLYFLS